MKKTVFFATLCLFVFAGLQAQDFTPPYYILGKLYPGYVILTDNTKIEGYLEALSPASDDLLASTNQNKVIFYTDPKNRKTKKVYKPADLKAYRIDDKYYTTIEYGDLIGKQLNFALLVKDGQIQTYKWFMYSEEHGMETRFVFRKGADKPVSQNNFILNFAKKMSDFVSDYTDLAAKIASKEKGYDLLHIETIIGEYNEWYAKNNSLKP